MLKENTKKRNVTNLILGPDGECGQRNARMLEQTRRNVMAYRKLEKENNFKKVVDKEYEEA